MYSKVLDIVCFSHTLDLVGSKFELLILEKIYEALGGHSYKSQLLWREQTGKSVKTYSQLDGGAAGSVFKQIMDMWGDV